MAAIAVRRRPARSATWCPGSSRSARTAAGNALLQRRRLTDASLGRDRVAPAHGHVREGGQHPAAARRLARADRAGARPARRAPFASSSLPVRASARPRLRRHDRIPGAIAERSLHRERALECAGRVLVSASVEGDHAEVVIDARDLLRIVDRHRREPRPRLPERALRVGVRRAEQRDEPHRRQRQRLGRRIAGRRAPRAIREITRAFASPSRAVFSARRRSDSGITAGCFAAASSSQSSTRGCAAATPVSRASRSRRSSSSGERAAGSAASAKSASISSARRPSARAAVAARASSSIGAPVRAARRRARATPPPTRPPARARPPRSRSMRVNVASVVARSAASAGAVSV